jgi:group I intron endonuclease
MYIYKTTNLINGKIYVGKKESDFDPSYLGSGLLINKAILKYGIENFIVEQIDDSESVEDLNKKEKFWISELCAQDIAIGYNICEGGEGGDTFSNNPNKEEIRKKHSLANKGRIHTEEARKNMSNARLGWVPTDETRKRMSASQKGNSNKKNKTVSSEGRANIAKGKIGQKCTEETRLKMSAAHKGRIITDEHRQKISASKKGTCITDEHKLKLKEAWKNRKPMSEETKQKIANSRLGKKRGPYKKITDDENI